MSPRTLSLLLRIGALVVALVAVFLFFVEFRQSVAFDLPRVARLMAWPLVVLAISLAIVGIADMVERIGTGAGGGSEVARNLTRVQQQLADVQHRLDDLTVNTDRLVKARPATQTPVIPQHITASLPPGTLQPIMQLLEEIRDVSLLTDQERKERLGVMEQERKLVLIREVIDHTQHRRWAEGDHILLRLAQEQPNDVDVKRARAQFDEARRNAEPHAVQEMKDVVENLMTINSWDQALQAAQRLVTDFPGNTDAKSLLARVNRERDIYRETSVARMVEEIRHDSERRLWRRALMHSQRLIERFPDHPKVHRIHDQLATLKENAEIEERQEMEVRIQELIRNRQLTEAIALSEELLQRFPNSKQAEAIEVLLPRIRELAREEQAGGATPAAPASSEAQPQSPPA